MKTDSKSFILYVLALYSESRLFSWLNVLTAAHMHVLESKLSTMVHTWPSYNISLLESPSTLTHSSPLAKHKHVHTLIFRPTQNRIFSQPFDLDWDKLFECTESLQNLQQGQQISPRLYSVRLLKKVNVDSVKEFWYKKLDEGMIITDSMAHLPLTFFVITVLGFDFREPHTAVHV